ncbi:hypothetical protein [Coleofasciculus sp.]|uniref:hypothetical protein n=1 Tax=Coleofasciculus sp. TaxID=3100458 RepID=UPI0039F7F9EF
MNLDWASCRLYLGVRFQAIATPVSLWGDRAQCCCLMLTRCEALPPTADRTIAATMRPLQGRDRSFLLPDAGSPFWQASQLCRLFQTDSSCH